MTGPGRVGVNVLYLVPGQVGGSEIYARTLIDAVARIDPEVQFVVYCGREASRSLAAAGWPSNVRVRALPVPSRVKPLRIFAEFLLLPVLLIADRVDLLHSLGTTSPPITRQPAVATVLDLIYEHFPSTFSRAARAGLRLLVGPGARRARLVIVISESVKRDVMSFLRVPEDRVRVVYPGFGMRAPASWTDASTLRDRLGLNGQRIVLCVSAALAHKNLPRLIDAFASLDDRDVSLVVVGHWGREQEALTRLARDKGVGDRVHLTGWIPDEELEGLYRIASCCVYPSLHEGFGLPVLEAMARGVPLACSNATSLPEVAGTAAELFDPEDTGAMAAAVRKLLDDGARRLELIEAGRRRAQEFTWERSAHGVADAYVAALSSARSRLP
jgi:glycosyltransferase involved in cell wall biosynthesis